MSTTEVVVGRIGKAHGIRGEVSVELRTDEPERRFADGAVLGTRTPRGTAPHGPDRPPPLTVRRTRWHQSPAAGHLREVADRTAAEALRGLIAGRRGRPGRGARGPRGVLRPPAGRARGGHHRRRRGRRGRRRDARRRPGPARGAHRRRPRGAGAVRDRARPGRRRGRAAASRSPTGPGLLTPLPRTRAERAHRRRLDLPRVPRAAAAVAGRQGAGRRRCSTYTCTTCGTGPTTGTAPSTTRRTAAAPAW